MHCYPLKCTKIVKTDHEIEWALFFPTFKNRKINCRIFVFYIGLKHEARKTNIISILANSVESRSEALILLQKKTNSLIQHTGQIHRCIIMNLFVKWFRVICMNLNQY